MCRRVPSIEANSKVVMQIAAEAAQSYQKTSRPYSSDGNQQTFGGSNRSKPPILEKTVNFSANLPIPPRVWRERTQLCQFKKNRARHPRETDRQGAGGKKEKGKGDLLIRDPRTKYKWHIDWWALLSILSPLPSQGKTGPNGTTLSAANGTAIPCYGKQ